MRYVVDLHQIDHGDVAEVGGKAANLAELTRIDGVTVPHGVCVPTEAYRRFVAASSGIDALLDQLARLGPDERDAIRAVSADVRDTLKATAIPTDVASAIIGALDGHTPYAVRSSATAEDLPDASFAGQLNSYLEVVGVDAVIEHVRLCWASLFTERAVTYRLRNGFARARIDMAVLVQRMVHADTSGVLFTADPVTSNRRVVSIEAVRGLGEALVSGRANADAYQVRDGTVTARTAKAGEPPVLTEKQALHLAGLGRRIEAHFGRPQDVEWCLAGGRISIVQSRPITTLFPVPDAHDGQPHVYVSVGHQQMMTDAMTPLGLSVWQLTTPRPMAEAGARLFVDVAPMLAVPAARDAMVSGFDRTDPQVADALQDVLDRGLIASVPDAASTPTLPEQPELATDPAVVTDLIEQNEQSVATLLREIEGRSGPELFDFVRADLQELRRLLFHPRSHQAIMAGMEAGWWLTDHLRDWLGEPDTADVLIRSVPRNVTSEMGLALLDLADAIRPHPDVVAFLQQVEKDGCPDNRFLGALTELDGGPEVRDAFRAFLDRYGARCAGEIDITRPRWSERPVTLVPTLLGNVRTFEAGAARRLREEGLREAEAKERELLTRLRELPDGARKAAETEAMIERVRTFAGYREYPKYAMIRRYFAYKQALHAEAGRLVAKGVLREPEDAFYLRFDELEEVARMHRVDAELIRERRDALRSFAGLTPPRVFTGEGEVITAAHRRDNLPPGALAGLAVSSGTVEGRARVVLDMAHADLQPGDILITAYTDPSWTPLFVAAAGLVTEVGGLMTHGAVIAREYGLPAVVGVENATRLIHDGQRIRLDGSAGHIQPLL